MITTDMIGKVLRMSHRDKNSVLQIVKVTSLARNTARKHLHTATVKQPSQIPGRLRSQPRRDRPQPLHYGRSD